MQEKLEREHSKNDRKGKEPYFCIHVIILNSLQSLSLILRNGLKWVRYEPIDKKYFSWTIE